MLFTLLGPGVPPLPPKERIILAALLLRRGEVVSVSALAEALWDTDPPPTTRNTIQVYVRNLRKSLGELSGRLITHPPGYLIQVRQGELDLDEFITLRDKGTRAADGGEWDTAAGLLAEALSLFPGEPLPDVRSAHLQRTEAPQLAETRQNVLELRIEADLRAGRHQMVVGELSALVAAHPMRERLRELLMLALYRSGRQSEALEEYQRMLATLRQELGIDPGTRVQALHERILAADPALVEAPRWSRPPVPRQLPTGLRDFTGRAAVRARLRDLLLARDTAQGVIPVAVLTGPPGIGKTALALQVGHAVADQFPDGQVFVSLGGTTDPVQPADALGRLLRDLNVTSVPDGLDERSALLRTLLAERSMLFVLDDAHSASQVRPLLPGDGNSCVLVTSRSALPDLAGSDFFELAVLGSQESARLLVAIAGERGDAQAVESVVASCGGLPLAIRIAASRLVTNPSWTVSQFGELLASEQRRLGELAVGDSAVRSAFEVSYRALTAGPARVFRLFGLTGLRTVSQQTLATMAEGPVDDEIRVLLDVHLLESPALGRITAHDLLRLYAAETSRASDEDDERRLALGRLFAWYMHGLVASQEYLGATNQWLRVSPPPLAHQQAISDVATWLGAEAPNLSPVVTLAYETGQYESCWQLAWLLRYYLDWSGRWNDDNTVATTGVAAARACGNPEAEAGLTNVLGTVAFRLGDLPASIRHMAEALRLRRELGDRRGEAESLCNVGMAELRMGMTRPAIARFTQARSLSQALNDPYQESYCLHNLGAAFQATGDIPVATAYYRQALALRVEHATQFQQAATLHSLGTLLVTSGSVDEGLRYLGDALRICREHELRYIEGMTLLSLGQGHQRLGDLKLARVLWRQAHEILVSIGAPEAAQALGRL